MNPNKPFSPKARLALAAALASVLAACGGGGSGRSGGPISTPAPQPSPSPTPAPAPAPSPTPTPTTNFITEEYRLSDGPDQHNAVTAWQAGSTGAGEIIAIVDTGIDTDSPEFAGRIHPDSRDVAGNRTIEQEDDHGTNVALVAAAARNGTGVMGIAFDASILVLRGDRPGTCATDTPEDTSLGCSFFDSDIATGIDQAVASGAAVVNLSLGGDGASRAVRDAVARAAAAGVVVVVAAGNAGDGSDPDTDPNEPTTFAKELVAAGNGNVIIVGSVDENNTISGFSQRAGSAANSFLMARGQRICCVYENGEIFIGSDAQGSFRLLIAGTSFAAPQVAGAVALMAQAFPNLTATEIVEILLTSARDLGNTGVDPIYGRGVLDIARAFQPAGATTLAGRSEVMRIGSDTAVGSPAMGDAFAGGPSVTGVLLDKYQRAYGVDIGAGMRGAVPQMRLHNAIDTRSRHVSVGARGLSLAFTIADGGASPQSGWVRQLRMTPEEAQGARVLAARMAARVAPDTQIGFTIGESAHGLALQVQGRAQPAFLIAGDAGGEFGFARSNDIGVVMRRKLGDFGLTLGAESGEAWLGNARRGADIVRARREKRPYTSFSVAADRDFGPFDAVLGLNWTREDETVLGAYFAQGLGVSGADSLFIDAAGGIDLPANWRLGASWRQGFTRPQRSDLVAAGSGFTSNAWSFDLTRQGVFGLADTLGFRVAQPLRVTSGGIAFDLPVGYDYSTRTATYGTRHISLAPTGREVIGEVSWRGPLFTGDASASLFYRTDPGHYAAMPDEQGVAVSWRKAF